MNLDPLFEAFPTLATARLTLRQPNRADAPGMFGYASDPQVAQFTTWEPHYSVTDSERSIDDFLNIYRYQAGVVWLLEERATHQLVGSLALLLAPRHRRAELGYALARSHWGQGLMLEAAQAVVALAFDPVGLTRIEARCIPENRASSRVMEKLGMRYEGCLRAERVLKGQSRDMALYALLHDEWLATQSLEPVPATATASDSAA